MGNTDPPIEVHRLAVRRKAWVTVAVVAALLAAVSLGWLWWQHYAVKRMISAIRARGEPVTPAELEALYERPPKEEDCTALYQYDNMERSRSLHAMSKTFPIVEFGGEPPQLDETWDELPAIEAFFSEAAVEFAKWHEAAARGGRVRFPINPEEGMFELLPETRDMPFVGQCLALEAHVRAYRGDVSGAAESLHAALVAARALENEPVPVAQFCRMAIYHVGINEINRLLPQIDFTVDELVRLQADLEATDFRAGLRRGLLGHCVIGIVSAQNPDKMLYHSGLHRKGELKEAIHYASKTQILAAFLAEQERLLAAVDKPWPTILDEIPIPTQPPFANSGWMNVDVMFDFVGCLNGYLRDIGLITNAFQRN